MGGHRRTRPGWRVASAGAGVVAVAAAALFAAGLGDGTGADAHPGVLALRGSEPTATAQPTTAPPTTPATTAAPQPPAQPTGPCAAGRVALTFDDGPQPGVTGRILTELVRLGVPATFFVEGRYVAAAPHLVARMAHTPGVVIGDHSWDHPDLTMLSRADVRSELQRTRRALVAAGAPSPTLMRYPFGSHDMTTDRLVERMGLRPVGWNLATHDPSQTTTKGIEDVAIERIDHAAGTGHRHFLTVLMHDGQPNSRLDVAAVPPIVREARRQGFCFTHARPEDPATLRGHDEAASPAVGPTPGASTTLSPSIGPGADARARLEAARDALEDPGSLDQGLGA